jgi:hypothetical protein
MLSWLSSITALAFTWNLLLTPCCSRPDSLYLACKWDSLKRNRVDCVPCFLIRRVRAQPLKMERCEQILGLGRLRVLVVVRAIRVECVVVWVGGGVRRRADVCAGAGMRDWRNSLVA